MRMFVSLVPVSSFFNVPSRSVAHAPRIRAEMRLCVLGVRRACREPEHGRPRLCGRRESRLPFFVWLQRVCRRDARTPHKRGRMCSARKGFSFNRRNYPAAPTPYPVARISDVLKTSAVDPEARGVNKLSSVPALPESSGSGDRSGAGPKPSSI